MDAIDPRIVKISFEINGGIKVYQNLAISAIGMKYTNGLQNEAEITISNLDKATQDYLLTETSPFNVNRTPKNVLIEAGRQSYGTSRIYIGNILTSNVTQPPDIGVVLKCLTGNFEKGNIYARNSPGSVTLNQVSAQLAQDLHVGLEFQASDKNLGNYAYAGSAMKQINQLNAVGGINVYLNDNTLIVKDARVPFDTKAPINVLTADSGMIGIPEFTEYGIKVKYLLDNKTILGSVLRIISRVYPAVNGDYVIYKLGFEITNRDTPFYWIAEAARR